MRVLEYIVKGFIYMHENEFNQLNLNSFITPQINYDYLDNIPTNFMWSDTQFEIIKKYIIEFEDNLDDEHEVCLMLTNFGQSVIMHVTDIGYEKSVLMVFKGYVDGNPATLIQHINQLNFLLVASRKVNPEQPKRRIGFSIDQANE